VVEGVRRVIRPRLAFRSSGDDGRPPLLLVHGMLASARQWEPNLAMFARHVRPIAVDLWGHGGSPAPADDRCYTIQAIVDQLDRVRERVHADRVILCGHSFGAGIVLRYALANPDRVVGTIVTNSLSAFLAPEAVRSDADRRRTIAELREKGIDAVRALPIHPSRSTRFEPEIRDRLIADADAVAPDAIARLLGITFPGLSVLAELERIRCPVLLVNGTREKAFQPVKDSVAPRFVDCTVVDVDAGHAVNIDNPGAFDAAVEPFLTGLLGRAPG
jgi:pimeloyl-ACP methyl ester carboxylesterase